MATFHQMRVLINTPNYRKPHSGGVANHYYGLQPFWNEKVVYNIVGSRNKEGSGKYWILYDVIKFIVKIIFLRIELVVVNPSLAANALKRDEIFLKIAKLLDCRVMVCFHGFNMEYGKSLNKKRFVMKFNKSDGFMVLAHSIKDVLIEWGITKPIFLFTTKIDDRLLAGYDVSNRQGMIRTVMYLSRVTKEKGIFISLDSFKLLSIIYPWMCFIVVGDGVDLKRAKEYASELKIPNITFTGSLQGDKLIDVYKNADLYLFTSYHEGMPTSVLEAMAFGLPIITRNVGGLSDFFAEGEMGSLIDSFDPQDFVNAIVPYIESKALTQKVSLYNHYYAKTNFMASNVAKNIEEQFKRIIRNKTK